MAKPRYRDVKQGRVKIEQKEDNKIDFVTKGDYFKAVLTDSFMLLMPIMYLVFYIVYGSREEFAKHWQEGDLYILIGLIIVESLFLIIKGQTPGMRAFQIKLISLYTKKEPAPWLIIVRQILAKIVFLSFAWIVIFFRKDNRNLHDIILHTALIYDKNHS